MCNTKNYATIEKAITYISDNYQNQPSLDAIAQHVHLSKFHFHRLFEDWAGVSPKSFIQYLTVEHAKELLNKGQSTLQTTYAVGLSGQGRLHDLFVKIESVSPGEFKNKGKNTSITYEFYNTLFGEILIAETDKGICHLSFITNKTTALKELQKNWQNASFIQKENKQSRLVHNFLYKKNIRKNQITLDLRGTDFQIKVWQALLKIPQGHLLSYQNVAKFIGHPNASRAVGTAIGKNPIAYIIPCHRVIRQTGKIGEYRWGSARKKTLVGWEAAQN